MGGYSSSEEEAVDRIVGGNLRSIRTSQGLSQEKLAAALGVTFQQVQKYEKGTNRLSASKMWSATRALKCSIMALYAGLDEGEVNETSLHDTRTQTGDELRLLSNYRRLTQRGKRAINDSADILAAAATHPTDPVLALANLGTEDDKAA